ncbi:MAG: hypothetical protein F6K32_27760 [Desertifilum sp. SIO1I2]|nr:hypothetical protein [Desertifilum sp. SIO1I2]
MKRYIFAAVSAVVLASAIAPVAKAEPMTANKAMSIVTATQPFNLVGLAYQGHFQDTGIPSYGGLIQAVQSGRVTAEDIVQSAVEQNRLASETLSDRGFIHAVHQHLQDLATRDRS